MMFPAPAGMSRPRTRGLRAMRYVPRARGDEPKPRQPVKIYQRMFPAPAGMSHCPRVGRAGIHDVPRARGDEPVDDWISGLKKPCSPRPRG